jgi:hypothetical protein
VSDFEFFCAGYGSATLGIVVLALAMPYIGRVVERWRTRRAQERRLRSARYVVGEGRRAR